MAIFDKELIDNTSDRDYNKPQLDLRSPETRKVDVSLGGFEDFAIGGPSKSSGLTIDQLSDFSRIRTNQNTFNSPVQMIPRSELLANQRYNVYERGKDLENIYGLQQSWADQLANGVVKFAAFGAGTFLQSFGTIPNTVSGLKTGKLSELSGGPDGYESKVDTWLKNIEDIFPNYYTRQEKESPFLAALPFAPGSANFWGDKIIKNLGFTAGAISGAVVQDLAIGAITGGLGEIPLVAAQLGKASLFLNKLFTGTNRLDEALSLAAQLGKTEKQILNIKRLGEVAAATKVADGARYALNIYGSARTEAAIEARDGYKQVRENLINQYKLENLGEEPTGADAKQIEELAINSMNTRFGINMALLTVSNAVQFGNLFKSFSNASSSGISGSLTRELEDVGKFGLKEGSMDVFESKAAKTLRGKIWESVKPKVANIFAEGVYEEGGQFAAERGTFDYYTRKYKNLNDPNNKQNWNELNEIINSTNKGLADQYGSEEGLENMFVGALSALISGGIMSKIDSVKGKGADARLQSTINMLNRYGITGMLQDNYTDTLSSAAIAKEMDAAAKSGNIFEYKNLKGKMFFNFVNSRIPSGMHDVTLEQLNMLKDLSKEEFEKTFGMDFNTSNKNTVDAYVDNLISNANKIKSTVDSLDSTFKNPFAKITDPKTPEEAVAANNHDVFNEWKTNLAYYAMVAPDANARLSSISQTVAGVNPLINNDLLGKLTDPTSLRELSSNYEERANQLNKTITEFTTPEDKKAIKAQVKALRTNAERINLAINNRDLDMKTFNSLLNFELNNLDSTKDEIVGMERASELYGYGVDINKLIGLKKSASSILDELASESGLEKFFKEAEEIASEEPPSTVPGEEEAPAAEVTPAVVPQYTNVKGKRENLELNREYEVAKLRPSKVNRLAEDRWQVISPDGTFEIYPTKEKAQEVAKDLDEEFASLAKVKIVALNEDGTVKVEDKDGNIYNIDTRKLSGFNKVESEQEKLQKIADQLGRQQQEIEKKSGIVATGNPSLEIFEKEDPKKSANILYTSTTGASETWEQLAKPHQVRSRQFLNNVKNFANRANIKTILVTPNQEESLGLKGLGELSGSTDTSVENGLVAAVYVVQANGKNYFVDKDGKQLTEVGQPVDMNAVVFSTMPTAALYNSKGDPRFRKQEEAQAKEMSRAWTVKRVELFAAPAGTYTIYDFGVSKGVPITDRNERKFVGDNLVPQKKIATQENLIVISTTGTLAYNGENLKFPVGRPVLQYGDTLQYVDNRTFTNDEAKSIFEAIRLLSEEVQSQNAKGETIELNRLYTDFLQNVLYWRKGKDTKDNQIHIDERSMELYIGGDKYNFADIASNEAAIVSKLKGTFNNVNNESLKKTSEPFTELYFENGFLQNREWANYQSYLLSSKYPDGKNRSITDTPLSTYVNKPTDAVPYNYVRKYAILEGLDLPVQQAAPAAAPVAEAAPSADKLGEFFVNGTENTISLKEPLGETKFTATINNDGNVVAEAISNPSIKAIAADAEKAKPYLDFLKNNVGPDGKPLFNATKSVEDSVLQFAALAISARLQAIKNQQAAPAPAAPVAEAAPVVTTAATVTQTTPYGTEAAPAVVTSTESVDKKADIERRRQESLTSIEESYDKGNDLSIGKATIVKADGTKETVSDLKDVVTTGDPFQRLKDKINTVYNAELAALEGKPAAPKNFGATKPPSNSEYRRVGANGVERINDAEIEIFKRWAAENVPGIPFEILDNIISTNDGEKAWGAFENGVAKFYKSAARGTEYHEVFEGIWKAFLTEEQRQAILDEFKSKPGTFTDRQSGKKIAYDQATDKQAKERIADDFADFKVGKLPARSIGERILNFFRNIIEFVKQFVNKPTKKQELFKAIEAGKFKEMTVPESVKNDMSEYRAVEGLTEKQTHEFVQDITARSFQIMFGTNTSLYNPEKLTAPDIFNQVKNQYAEEGKLELLGENAWNQLVNKTKEFLRTFKLEFDENQSISINDENVNKNDYTPEPFSTDWKKSSSFAIKLLIGTLTETTPSNQENSTGMALPAQKLSDVMGYKLLNFTRSFATVLDKLANTTKVTSVVDKLVDLAKYDSNYVRLFTRVGGNRNNMVIDFSKFEAQDWRLFVNFYQTFTKQKPDALIQYISGNEVYTGSANLYTAANSVKEGWIENMKALSKVEGSLISYNSGTKTYKVGDVSNITNKTPEEMISFLGSLGIEFPMEVYSKLKAVQKNKFANAIGGLIVSLRGKNDILSVTGKVLDINGPLSLISELYVKVTNPNIDATYFNVENKRTNAFSENNAPSLFENLFNEANTLDELLETRPELKDIFSATSQVLKKGGLFFDEDGNRIRSIKVSYIQGTKLVDENDGTATSRLTEGERFTQEFNQNLNGNYYVLIPADGSTEWMMNLGNNVRFSAFENGTAWGKVYTTFKGYLKDEINLALTAASRTQLMNVGDKASELRFFKDILSKDTLAGINNLIAKEASEEEINAFIEANIEDINKSIKDYIDGVSDVTFKTLAANGEIYVNTKGEYSYPKLDDVFAKAEKFNKFKLSEKKLNNIISFANANYIINNIEYHKILFGDPYQFKIKDNILDETKRVKSFLSGRRTTFDFPDYNTFLNQELNKAGEIELNEGDPGFQKFKPYTNTITLKDVKVLGRLLGETNEADAASYLMDGTYREVKNKNGQWSDEAEDWHQWQMAYTRNRMAAKGDYTYTNDSLRAQDEKTISKPEPKYVTEVLKPIVTGNKYGSTQFDLVLDKFSQMPLYYKAVEGTNLEKLYVKMMKEDVGYVIFESGRKVGTETLYSLYNGDGSLNDAGFDNKIQVPWSAYGIQVENSYEGSKQQTRGSQATKLASLNLFNNGVATSPEAAREYARNKEILDRMHENGYNELLRKLGIEDLGDGFKLTNNVDVSKLLEYEMLRREMSDNAKDTVQLDENGQFRIPFEASNAYVQIRNILYSMVDKAITSPKMNGGPKVQVPVTGWENAKAGRKIALKTKDGFKEISKVEYNNLSEEDKKKVRLTDDTLKFYTKDQPYCEVLLPHWFKVKFGKKFPDDKALLNYLNSTAEGRSILTGVGFRIPTQELSNIEVFRVKGFLPQSMGDTIVVPSEITTKAGSDFDIDKLNTYLKATYLDKNGDIRLVKYKGSEEATKEFYTNVFNEMLDKKTIKKNEILDALYIMNNDASDPENLVDRYSGILDAMISELGDVNTTEGLEERLAAELDKLSDATLQAELKDKYVRDMYKKSLENEYYDSLTKLLTLPENFERLISPIGDAGLKDLASKLDKLRGYDESTIKNRMLDRNYLTKLRHAFVTAKRWVGIAAVNITNHSLTQKISAYVDPSKFELVNEVDRKILGDGKVALPHNTVNINGEERISLSSILDKAGKYISGKLSGYATAFVDVAKDPYILKIIGSDLAVGTFMYLERIGVPIETTAMFMNQPIIKEYLTYLDNTGARGLFNQKNIDAVKSKFVTTGTLINSAGVSLDTFEDNISEYYSKGELSEPKNAEQHVILNEFLKYAKMAEYLFNFGQAINYDTTKFRSGDALFKKETRTEVAEDINIISSVNELLDASFIGKQAELIASSMEAMGEIFKLEKDEFRVITNSILKSFAKDQYLSADDYDRIANKLKASFLDYIIQTKSGLNSEIKAVLVDAGTSVASQLAEAKRKNPGLTILNDLQVVSSDRVDGAKSIKLLANNKDAYDENLYTGYMRELRDNPSTTELYNNIVKLSILQGTYQTGISIKNIIPLEDYSKIIAPVIAPLVSNDSLKSFAQGAFQRNNWKDNKIFGKVSPKFFLAQETPIAVDIYDNDIYQYFSPAFPNIKNLGIKSTDRKILLLSERYNAASLKYDFVKVPRVVEDPFTGTRVNMTNGETVTNSMFAIKKSKGDLSLKDIYGYQKVKYADGSPVIVYDDKGVGSHVYKLVNLYGDGQLASEYYENNIPSVLNNGTVKIANEITDEEIIAHYGGQTQPKVVPLQSMAIGKPEFNKLPAKIGKPTMTYAGIGSRQTPPEVLKQMTEVAKQLESKGYTLNTGITFGGKEEGADKAFSDGATNKNLFSPEKQGSRAKEQAIANEMHPNPSALTQGALKLMARNTNQIFGDNLDTPVDFVLFYAKETASIRPQGGTGQAVEMARLKGIPTINMANPNWREELNAALTQSTKPQPVIDSSKKINIYAGTGENAELSNFANRPFTTAEDLEFENVEGAFQAAKLLYSSVYNSPDFGLTPSFYDMLLKFQEYSGANAKSLGRQIKGLNTKAWDANSSRIMKELMKASFEQNPSALKALLATGNAELTHTQDGGKWGKEFPRLLMEVREELKPKAGLSAYVTLEQLEADKSFLNTAIEFVDEISTNKDVPVAMRNLNKGEKIQMVKDLMQKKFDDKAWTSPATQADGSKATALPAEQFKSFNEFLTFALLHEKAHETISKVSGETIGQYEDRINAAALNNMPKPPAEFEGDLEGADNPNPCGQ